MRIKYSVNIQYPFFLFPALFFVLCSLFFVEPSFALTISPPLIEIEADPGAVISRKVKLFNETNQVLSIYPTLENFAPQKENNLLKYLGNNDSFGAARWIELSGEKIDLKSGEAKEISLEINIPLLAEPGGHYAALFWSDASLKKSGVSTANRLATIFLFKIKGEIKENLKVVSFKKSDDKNNPGKFELQIENNGNSHLRPHGQIKIFNRRREPVGILAVNPLGQVILPQSRRNFEVIWPEAVKYWGTHYAQAKIFFGEKNQELASEEIKFFLESDNPWFSVIGFVFIAVLVLVIISLARRNKKKKEYGL